MPSARVRLHVGAGVAVALALVTLPLLVGVRLRPLGLLEAALGSALLVGCSALALNGSRPTPLPARQAVPAVLAMTAANAVTPAGVGGALLVVRLHKRSGLTGDQAVAAAGLRSLMGALTATAATVFVASQVRLGLPSDLGWVVPAVVAAALAVTVALPRTRRHLVGFTLAVADVVRRPRCFASLLVGCVGVTVAQLLTLEGAVHAVGGHVPWLDLLAALMGSAAARSAVPSPGGVGPIEAALVGGLSALGLSLATATVAVAVYRTAGHWLPVLGGVVSLRGLRRTGLA